MADYIFKKAIKAIWQITSVSDLIDVIVKTIDYITLKISRLTIASKMIKKVRSACNNIVDERIKMARSKFKPVNKDKKINIGAGEWYIPYWENIDYFTRDSFIDYKLNLLEKTRFPILDNNVKKIFTSHLLEHLDDDATLFLLKECYRILGKGGILRISTPDMDKAFTSYEKRNKKFFLTRSMIVHGNSFENWLVDFFANYSIPKVSEGPIINDQEVITKYRSLNKYDFVKWCISLLPKDVPPAYIGHRNGFDFAKLKQFLLKAGFRNVMKSSFRKSTDLELRGKKFDNRPDISLFVEVAK